MTVRKIDWTPEGALEHLRRISCEPEDEDACDAIEEELKRLREIHAAAWAYLWSEDPKRHFSHAREKHEALKRLVPREPKP